MTFSPARFRRFWRLFRERWTLPADERLRRACGRGDLTLAQSLVAQGAGVDAPRPRPAGVHFLEPSDRTPLHLAAVCGQPEVVAWLLEQGADPCVYDRPRCDTPAHLAVWQLQECLKKGDEEGATDYRIVLGFLWAAKPSALRQQNKFEQSALDELKESEETVASWAQALTQSVTLTRDLPAAQPAAPRARL